jgi:oxygen-independent coproporphyrinogen-3 oxidase
MYGIPLQNHKSWLKSLKNATELLPTHISAYCLSLEPDTYLGERREQFDFPDEDTVADMYYEMLDFLSSKGYNQYEISNFARPNYEAKHNLTYWRGEEYIGFGASAHSFYNMERLNNYSDIKNYIDCLHKGRTPIAFRKQVSIEEFISDCIVLGLRLNQGISLTRFKERYNFDILEKYKTVIERLAADGYLVLDNDKLRLSRRALFVSNSILSEFI